jgi:hypothetical protein
VTATDDQGSTPPHRSAKGSPYLLPGAIVVGFALVAAAVFFGLRGKNQDGSKTQPSEVASAPDLTLPDDQEEPWIEVESEAENEGQGGGGGSVADAAPPPARPPKEVHDPGAFATRWLPQRAAAEKTCNPTAHLKLEPSIWYVELALELDISADGRIRRVRRFAKPRAIADSGAYAEVAIDESGEEQLVRCYAEQVAQRVRFDPATGSSQLKAWVRIISTVDRPQGG